METKREDFNLPLEKLKEAINEVEHSIGCCYSAEAYDTQCKAILENNLKITLIN